MTRLLDVITDESALEVRFKRPAIMVGQLRRLLGLVGSPPATVRCIPGTLLCGRAVFMTSTSCPPRHQGLDRRQLLPVPDAQLASGDLHDAWALVKNNAAVGLTHSRAILERHLAALS